MKKTRNMLILLLLLLVIPFNIHAEGEDGLGNPSVEAPDTDAIYGIAPDGQMPTVDEVVLPDSGDLTVTNEDDDVIMDEMVPESVDSSLPETTTLTKSSSDDVSGVELATKPGSIGVWIYLVVVFTVIVTLFGTFIFIFFKIFAAYSSVLEKNDDNAENIITIR